MLVTGTRLGQPTTDIVFAMGVIMALGVLVLHPWGRWPGRQLARCRSLGACSYTLYLTHMPVVLLIAAIWVRTYGAVPSTGWLGIGGVAAAVIIAMAAAPLVEAPFTSKRGAADGSDAKGRRRVLLRRAADVVADIESRGEERRAA
jgi:peptidoglycan/LPS O-acetylase OafA/YrhL